MKYFMAIFLIVLSYGATAENSWYWGKATAVTTYKSDGSFIVWVDNQEIVNNCKYKRVVVDASMLGAERTKAAMSIALSALHSGKDFGVVLDLSSSGGGVCNIPGSTSQGVGVRN